MNNILNYLAQSQKPNLYREGDQYLKGDVVYFNNDIYMALCNITEDINSNQWLKLL